MEEYKKIIKMDKKLLIIVVMLAVFILAAYNILMYNMNSDKREEVVKNYKDLIISGKDVENEYVEIEIVKLPHGIDNEKTDLGYETRHYFVSDKDGFEYIVSLSGSTYKLLEEMYAENPTEFSYKLKGYIFEYSNQLKSLAIKEYNRINQKELLNEENFETIFGKTYLSESKKPFNVITGIALLIGFVSVIAMPFCILFCIKFVIGFILSKLIIKKNYMDLENELSNSNVIAYKKTKIYLTNKYIISKNWCRILVLEYNKLIWIYHNDEQNEYGLPTGRMKFIGHDANSEHLIALIKDEKILKEIMDKIVEKNPEILVGYTLENKEKYKEKVSK